MESWMGLKKDINHLNVNTWKELKVLSRFIQKYLWSSYFFGRRVLCAQTAIFVAKPASKNAESQQLFFGGRLLIIIFEKLQHPAIQIKVVQHFGGFLYHKNVHNPVSRKKGFYTKRVPKKQKFEGIFVFRSSELWTLSKYSSSKFKNYGGWCPFQGLSNSTPLMQI